MKLLITTQKVDETDHNLGFFTRWIEEFGKHASHVTVICLEEGEHHFGTNVSVLSLGKEKNNSPACAEAASASRQFSRLRRAFCLCATRRQVGGQAIFPPAPGQLRRAGNFQSIFTVPIFRKSKYAWRFLKYLWRERRDYDAVFVHMNPEYLLLGGILWRLLKKKVGFWYTHQSKRFLKSALFLADHVFTPSEDSFPIRTKKTRVVGHGIDTELFAPRAHSSLANPPLILSDTRLAPSKHVERTLEISKELGKLGVAHAIHVIGSAITKQDREYEKELRGRIQREHLPVSFLGGVPFRKVPDYYGKADIFINHANVGALNKTVLQAMTMNLPVFTSNESYRGILPDAQIVPGEAGVFAAKIQEFLQKPFPVVYRERILRDHSLQALIPKILRYYA